MRRDVTIEIICGLLVLLFVYTSISKLLAYHSFAAVLRNSPLIGNYADVMAILLPVAELAIAIMLLVPSLKGTGLYASFILMLAFTGYICYMLLFSPHLPCSCGGAIAKLTWKQHLVFNILFSIIAFTGIRLHRKEAENLVKE